MWLYFKAGQNNPLQAAVPSSKYHSYMHELPLSSLAACLIIAAIPGLLFLNNRFYNPALCFTDLITNGALTFTLNFSGLM